MKCVGVMPSGGIQDGGNGAKIRSCIECWDVGSTAPNPGDKAASRNPGSGECWDRLDRCTSLWIQRVSVRHPFTDHGVKMEEVPSILFFLLNFLTMLPVRLSGPQLPCLMKGLR